MEKIMWVVLILILCFNSESFAASSQTPGSISSDENAVMQSGDSGGLAALDWGIIGLYTLFVIGLGWFYSRRQKNTKEYFLGSGNMHPVLIGVSLFATLLSTISYLSIPGEMLSKGPVALFAGLLGLPIIYFVVGYGMLPVYMRHRVTSAYELLEERLGIGIRLLGAGMFVLLRLVWMSLLIYLAAKAMVVMLGVEAKWIWLITLSTGLVSVIYSSLGGLRAVVITDLVQAVLLFAGAVLVIVTVSIHLGGIDWIPMKWQDHWDTQPIFSFDPSVRLSFVGNLLTGIFWFVCTAGGDQTAIQRFMATGGPREARRSLLTTLLVNASVLVVLALVGFALLGFFKANPNILPEGLSVTGNGDYLFPRYISYHLPVGLSGLVVAAMFAAAMSSVDSGINSITAVVTTDFLDRFGYQPKTEKQQLFFAKVLAFTVGAVVVIGSSFMEHVRGNITEVTTKTNGLLISPLFALFVFALFVPFAKPAGVIAGAICGFAAGFLIAFSGPLFGANPETGYDPVSFMWVLPASLLVNLIVGILASLLWPKRK